MSVVLDSYSEDNRNTTITIRAIHPSSTTAISGTAQSFKTPAVGQYKLNSAIFFLKRIGVPDGTLIAYLYTHSGTYGTSSVPTGNPLALSGTVIASSIDDTDFVLITFNFTGVNAITLDTNTSYCIAIVVYDGTWEIFNNVQVGMDSTAPTHEGNNSFFRSSAWTAQATDLCFYVTGMLITVGGETGNVIPILISNVMGD